MRGDTYPDIAAGAGPVLDDQRAADRFAQMGCDNARHDVGRAARREGHDDLDRAIGIVGGVHGLRRNA